MGFWNGLHIKVLNIAAFALGLSSNVYTVVGPNGTYGDGKETYVTPSDYAFWIWTLIYLLLLGFIFFQFTTPGEQIIVEAIAYRFAFLVTLNSIFLFLWSRGWYLSAFVFSLLLAASVSQVYYIINRDHSRRDGWGTELFVHLPFSLYHGWTIVLIVIALFQAFGVDSSISKAGFWTKFFVFLAFVFLESTAAGYAFATAQGDPAGASVIAWALFSIFIHQEVPFIRWSAFAFFILSLFAILKALYSSWRTGSNILHDDERAPLIAGEA
ncbi:uncharacterized protein LOC62_04G005431 [Vanrija pseudolonga]|uniref:Uncharacterized protein n=1 Tax=Vanrija pseudolonga TaxID=143232 RepID=A0AAF0YCF7_9TREE|nr:hypothetical protein LOC62_04G005431 [Vanrija pseudolonga]